MKLVQEAPYPQALADLVKDVSYKPGWRCALVDEDRGQGARGLTLEIIAVVENSYHPGTMNRIRHLFIVPAASYDARSWRRWLFERFCDVERHEAMEFFTLRKIRPFAPHHAPGNDPYLIFEHGTEEDVRTDYRGVLHSEPRSTGNLDASGR